MPNTGAIRIRVAPVFFLVFPSPYKGEDEGEGPCIARFFARDLRFCLFSESAPGLRKASTTAALAPN
ncbi:MAG TPA: hypothetical protein VNT29_08125, partial [Candidatus Limnocylindrales bacterium]|nr:hypothetical protein [Candidatus Limnocylindrales bacterium]